MLVNTFTPVVIFALNRADEEEDLAVIKAELGIHGRAALHGCYKDDCELSYLLPITEGITLDKVLDLAYKYEQEVVLYLDNQRSAYMVHTEDGAKEYIGTYKPVCESVAKKQKSYTYDPINNSYYAVV